MTTTTTDNETSFQNALLQKWRDQAEMLTNRVIKNHRRLSPWLKRETISCYRLYDRDIPEVALKVDWYEGRLHMADFGDHEGTDTARNARLSLFAARLAEALALPPGNIYLKRHQREKGGTQYARLGLGGSCHSVSEGGLCFLVNLSDFLDTGLFLDHRTTRQMVRDEAAGKRFLNLFAYSGSFSVYAAAGGATETTTVDLSHTYLDWAERNMRKNGFTGERHRFIRDDILSALEENRASGVYDLIVLDPPTVSKSKSMKRSFDIQKDHVLLLNRTLGILAPKGILYFSTNYQRFRLRMEEIICSDIREITQKTVPRDFHNKRPHRCWRLQKA